jgi:hypothetical protein
MYHPGIVWKFLEGDEDGMLKSISMTDRDFLYVLNSINTDTLFTFNTLNIPIRQIDSLELNVKYIDQELVSNEK